jgi:hypothetical protein
MVAVGAAGDDVAVRSYHEDAWNGTVVTSSFRFGEPVGSSTTAASRETVGV